MTRDESRFLAAEVHQAQAVIDALRPLRRTLADALARIDAQTATAEAVIAQCQAAARKEAP